MGNDGSPMRTLAGQLVRQHLRQIVGEKGNEDLLWLPDDFGVVVTEIAWNHQFDIDKAKFRRRLKQYLKRISEQDVS